MIRNESLTFCPGEKPWANMMPGGYRFLSQDIFHFLPLHPFATKNLNGRLVNDDNLYRYRDISSELQPLWQFICFQRKSLWEKSHWWGPIRIRFRGQKIEETLKIIPRWGRSSDNGCVRGQWLWCGQDWGEEGDPPPADLDLRDQSWLDATMMTVTERIRGIWMSDSRLICGLWLL